MNKSAVVSVIFPSNLVYFNSFLKSLQAQTENAFDLVLITDSIEDIGPWITGFKDSFQIFTYPLSGSIAGIREHLLDLLMDLKYDQYIFADTDDLLHPHRVSISLHHLEKYPFAVNDLVAFADEKVIDMCGYWSGRLADGQVFGQSDILQHNFVGLGNTSVRKAVLRSLSIPDGLQGVDWFIFFQLLKGLSGIFLHGGAVLYRQHEANMVGVNSVSKAKLVKVADTKMKHYSALVSAHEGMRPLLAREQEIYNKLINDTAFATLAEARLNTKQMNYFWWEETEYINE
jgi:hypothetical protein